MSFKHLTSHLRPLCPSPRYTFVTFAALFLAASPSAWSQPGLTPPGSISPSQTPPPGQSYYPPSQSYQPQPPGPPPTAYYVPHTAPPLPPQYPIRPERSGLSFGVNLGLGDMESSSGEFACAGCDETPVTGSVGIHLGAMLTSRFAVQGEVWHQSRALDINGDASINQTLLLLGLQFWLTDRFWLKGAAGAAILSFSQDTDTSNLNEGSAFLAAVGYELMHSNRFAWDLQLRSGTGLYQDDFDKTTTITSSTITMGLSWF